MGRVSRGLTAWLLGLEALRWECHCGVWWRGDLGMRARAAEGLRAFGARTLRGWLAALRREIGRVRKARDREAVHRVRVLSRRLQTALAVLEDAGLARKLLKRGRKRIGKVTQRLGAARDTDVQIEFLKRLQKGPEGPRPGVAWLLRERRAQRRRLQVKVARALDRLELSGVLPELERELSQAARTKLSGEATAELRRCAGRMLARRMAKLLGFESYVRRPTCREELHAMRIAAKKLRYALELFGPLFGTELDAHREAARELQKLLGEIHDCDVWSAFLAHLRLQGPRKDALGPEPPQGFAADLARIRTDRRRHRRACHRNLVRLWTALRRQAQWERLEPLPHVEENALLIRSVSRPAGTPEPIPIPNTHRSTEASNSPFFWDLPVQNVKLV